MQADRLDAACERAAEQAAELGLREFEERAVAVCLQPPRQIAAEVAFDDRPPERPQVVGADRRAVGAAVEAAV